MGSYSKKQLQDQIKHAGFFFFNGKCPYERKLEYNFRREGADRTDVNLTLSERKKKIRLKRNALYCHAFSEKVDKTL